MKKGFDRRELLKRSAIAAAAAATAGIPAGEAEASPVDSASAAEQERLEREQRETYDKAMEVLRSPVETVDAARFEAEGLLRGFDVHDIADLSLEKFQKIVDKISQLNREINDIKDSPDKSRVQKLKQERAKLNQEIFPSFPADDFVIAFSSGYPGMSPIPRYDANVLHTKNVEVPACHFEIKFFSIQLELHENIKEVTVSWVVVAESDLDPAMQHDLSEAATVRNVSVSVSGRTEDDNPYTAEYYASRINGIPDGDDGSYVLQQTCNSSNRKASAVVAGPRNGEKVLAELGTENAQEMTQNDLIKQWDPKTTKQQGRPVENTLHLEVPEIFAKNAGLTVDKRLSAVGL